jgi:Fe-Mn family superoxide dismutase
MFILPELPYAPGALAPVLSDVLMRTHHGKHHKTYVDNVNRMLSEAGKTPPTLEAVVQEAADTRQQKLFNNAAQAWNHAFFWECMTPDAGRPEGALAEAIQRDLGGLDALRARFVEEGATHFASGWAWLVVEGGELKVISTHDAETPITRPGMRPVLVCDVWEHAYYLDHKQDRKGFLEQWFDGLANWRFAAAQYDAAAAGAAGYRYPAPNAVETAR